MTITGAEVQQGLKDLAQEVFGLSLDAYLRSHHDRLLFGVASNSTTRTYTPLFGAPSSLLISVINGQFVDALAGYRVSIATKFAELSAVNADVFVVADSLLQDQGDLTPLLLHELCHWVIDSGQSAASPLKITSKDKKFGKQLHEKTDRSFETATRHTLEFCVLLSAAAQRLSTQQSSLGHRWAILRSAMRADLKGLLRQ